MSKSGREFISLKEIYSSMPHWERMPLLMVRLQELGVSQIVSSIAKDMLMLMLRKIFLDGLIFLVGERVDGVVV